MSDKKIGDFGDRNASGSDLPEQMEVWTRRRLAEESLAKQAIQQAGAKLETHKVLVLVDLQGMYLKLHQWLRDQDFPIEDGLTLSRLATFQILDVFDRIKANILKSSDDPVLDFDDLLQSTGLAKEIHATSTYLRFVPEFELFYAPSPLGDIEQWLRKEARKGSSAR